jgi:hypothetical protein
MRAAAWVIFVAAGQFKSQFWDLTATSLPSFAGSDYDAEWELSANTACPIAQITAADTDEPAFHASLCSALPKAAGYIAAQDAEGSPALCGQLLDLLKLCASMDSCHSVTWNAWLLDNTLDGRGYLNSLACGTAGAQVVEARSTLYVKKLVLEDTLEACPLGMAAELTGGAHKEVQGLYEKRGFGLFQQLDGLSRTVWHSSQCGWVVEAANYVPVTPPDPPAKCADLDDHVRMVFGSSADLEGSPCATAQAWSVSYCAHPVFAALCSVSCGTDCFSNQDSAVASWTGKSSATCGTASCEDAMVAAFCPQTCAGRRLLASEVSVPAHVRLEIQGHAGRRLGYTAGGKYEEVYRTFASPVCERATPDDTLLSATTLYDVRAYHVKVPWVKSNRYSTFAAKHTCAGRDDAWFVREDTYCSRNNIPAKYSGKREIGMHGCEEKCGNNTVDTIDATGANDWCSGNDEAFTDLTDALCLPREDCERLCLFMGDECYSFDMHRTLPRCYLNTPACESTAATDWVNGTIEYDMIVKTVTPTERTGPGYGAVNDDLRDTFITHTGKTCPRGNHSSTSVYTTRDDCEYLCSTTAGCVGFSLVQDGLAANATCTLISGECFHGPLHYADTVEYVTLEGQVLDSPLSALQLVEMVPHKVCTVEIDGYRDAISGIDFTGVYPKVESKGGEVYLRPDNKTRLHYVKGEADSMKRPTCDDWFMEVNTADPTYVTLYNCSDATSELVNLYLEHFLQIPGGDFPCQRGYDGGLCSDAVFGSLCPHTCAPLHLTSIGGESYTYQNLSIFIAYPDPADYPASNVTNVTIPDAVVVGTCNVDNDFGAWSLSSDLFKTERPDLKNFEESIKAPGFCYNITSGQDGGPATRNETQSPCWTETWSPLLQWLCPETCALYDVLAGPTPEPPTDETDPVGATWSGNRKLSYTVSRGGVRPTEKTIPYLDGFDETSWYKAMRTFVNGSDDGDSPYSDTACLVDAIDVNTAPMYRLLDRLQDAVYLTWIPTDPTAEMKYVCKKAAPCPTFAGCVMEHSRMESELEVMYAGTKPALGDTASWLNFDTYGPKLLISPNRATNLLTGTGRRWELQKEMFRSAPGAMSLSITKLGVASEDSSYALTLVSPASAGGYYAETELGRSYGKGPGAGYGPWVTDIMRFEKFGANKAPATGTAEVKVFLGEVSRPELLQLFIVRKGQSPVLLDAPRQPLSPTMYGHQEYTCMDEVKNLPPVPAPCTTKNVDSAKLTGYFIFELPEANADYIAAMDIDECTDAPPCALNAMCTNGPNSRVSGPYKCECMAGYEPTPDATVSCSVAAGEGSAYSDAMGSIYVRITPDAPLPHGWRVSEVFLYSDEACTKQLKFADVAETLPAPEDPESDTTWTMLTSETNVYTGPLGNAVIGYSHYPHAFDLTDPKNPFKYSNKNLFDEQSSTPQEVLTKVDKDGNLVRTQWLSECLQCEAGEVVIEFALKSSAFGAAEELPDSLGCVRVVQDPDFAVPALTVQWGPVSGPGCGLAMGQERCPPTMIYSNTTAGKSGVVDFKTVCGVPETQIFGEILEVAQWEGSYANDIEVPSACACHRLCLMHLKQGCRTYKFLDHGGIKHCYLQRDAFAPGEGFYGVQSAKWPGWSSGTPAIRYVKNGKPSAMPWILSVTAEPAAAVGAGEEFALTISAAGLPYSSEAKADTSTRQRVKLIKAGDPCSAPLPKEVDGIYCIDGGSASLLCGPAPTEASTSAVTFAGVSISRAEVDREYDVCYCALDCSELARWQKVPGALKVPASVFKWETTPETVYRKNENYGDKFEVTVTAPYKTTIATNEHWEMKLVRDWFGCGVEMDPSLFTLDVESGADRPYLDPYPADATTTPAPGGNASNASNATAVMYLTPPAGSEHYYYYQPYRGGGFSHSRAAKYKLAKMLYAGRGSASEFGTRSCNGPDQCTWTFLSTVELENVGDYVVCFRESSGEAWSSIPASDGRSAMEVKMLSADHTHPRVIFHNQYFSALSGAAATKGVLSGSRMEIPSSAALAMTKGKCGDTSTYSFPGALMRSSADSIPPSIVPSKSIPAPGDTIGDTYNTSFLFAFDEPVLAGAGAFRFFNSGNMLIDEVSAANAALVSGNTVIVKPTSLSPGNYYIEVETGAVTDLAGNDIPLQVLDADYTFTVAGGALHGAPVVLGSDPANSASADTNKVSLYFSDAIALNTSSTDLVTVKLGDTVIQSFKADTLTVKDGGSILEITLNPLVAVDHKTYTINIPAYTVQNIPPSGPALAMAADFVFVLDKTSSGFSPMDHVAFVDSTSTADGLSFSLQLSADTVPGIYSICYCSGQTDTTLAKLGDGDTTYALDDDVMCSDPVVTVDSANELMGYTLEEHFCVDKCAAGCLGAHCYCDGYHEIASVSAEAESSVKDALCLPKNLCADACDMETGCYGIGVHDTLPICFLFTACDSPSTAEDMQFFKKHEGTACTHFADFTEKAGVLSVTNRVEVGVDYVATPKQLASIEVTGANAGGSTLMNAAEGLLSSDRIMIIDCGGTCGISGPSESLDMPRNSKDVETWNLFWPKTYFNENASTDAENPADVPYEPVTAVKYGEYVTTKGRYCSGNNVQITAFSVPFEGSLRPLSEYGCWQKCSEECVGDHCFCDGYLSGFDSSSSNALCADTETCQYLCDNLEECTSIDVSTTMNRCYLNMDGCYSQPVDYLAKDPTYNFMMRPKMRQLEGDRKLEATPLPIVDLGFSWGSLLRFGPIRFTSGGTFKLCFCDSALPLPHGKECRSVADYSVEVGTVHASGVSCLIAKPELQRAACVEQHLGGLRCYRDREAAEPPLPVFFPTVFGTPGGDEILKAFSTYCLYQPEEAAKHTGCDAVSRFQGILS